MITVTSDLDVKKGISIQTFSSFVHQGREAKTLAGTVVVALLSFFLVRRPIKARFVDSGDGAWQLL